MWGVLNARDVAERTSAARMLLLFRFGVSQVGSGAGCAVGHPPGERTSRITLLSRIDRDRRRPEEVGTKHASLRNHDHSQPGDR